MWDSEERAYFTNIEWKLGRVLDAVRLMLQAQGQERDYEMATQATLDKLTADVAANTSAVASATAALTGFVKTTADLTTALNAAIATAGIDDPTVLAAASAIEANNTSLTAAIPVVASAVAKNLK